MSFGWIPKPIRRVKGYVAEVQPGDSVSRIAHRLTGDASRWPELVGANLHKQLAPGNVSGSPYRVFESLEVGEDLMVPASWPDPAGTVGGPSQQFKTGGIQKTGSTSQVSQHKPGATPLCEKRECAQMGTSCGLASDGCGGMLDCGSCPEGEECHNGMCAKKVEFEQTQMQNDPIGALIGQLIQTYVPGLQPPAPYQIPDVTAVVSAWWPYFANSFPGVLPATPPVTPTPTQTSVIVQLINSAIQFLGNANIPPDQLIAIVSSIPWDKVPWDKIPWQVMQQMIVTASRTPVWQMLINSFAIQFGGAQQMKPMVLKGSTGAPDFRDSAQWSTDPSWKALNAFGWQNVPWEAAPDAFWTSIANDPELAACMQTNSSRLTQMVEFAGCFAGRKDLLKKYLCAPTFDIEALKKECAETALPDPAKSLPNINYACSPQPQCIADQLKGLPPVCSPLPECIPAWYKKITGQDLPDPPPTKTGGETKSDDSNLGLKVALGAGGIALAAGIIVLVATRD